MHPSHFSTKLDETNNITNSPNKKKLTAAGSFGKSHVIASAHQNLNSPVYSNTSSEYNNTTAQSPKSVVTSKPFIHSNHTNQNQKSIITLNDQIKQNPKQFLRKTSASKNVKPLVVSAAELAPIKDKLHMEILNRMSKKDGNILRKTLSGGELKKPEVYIDVNSTPVEVKSFLECKEFSRK